MKFPKTLLFLSVICLILLVSCGGGAAEQPPTTPDVPLIGANPPFTYVGNLSEGHAYLYEYVRDDGKICLITGAMNVGMDVSVSCTGEASITTPQEGITHIGSVFMGNIDVYEYTRSNGQMCTIVSGHGHGTLIDISC